MASTKAIKKRKDTIESTGKITRAMKLVSTVKLQKSKQRAEESIPYFDTMYETVQEIASKSRHIMDSAFAGLKIKPTAKKLVIAITSNRGLAGGFNNNIVKKISNEKYFSPDDTAIMAIGKKGLEGFARKGYEIKREFTDEVETIEYVDAINIANETVKLVASGEVKELYLVYSYFKNTVVHIPRVMKLMPFDILTNPSTIGKDDEELLEARKKVFQMKESKYQNDDLLLMNYEPSSAEVLRELLFQYFVALIYGALVASNAAENGARMNAMDNATKNSEEMAQKLNVQFNRARQGAITNELTEIISGANAINQ